MDALSALAIATAAVQFIDFGNSLISGTIERYHSVAGAVESHLEIELVASRLHELLINLKAPAKEDLSGARITSQHNRQLERIVKSCEDAADQLLTILLELKARGKHKLTDSFLATVKAIRKERKVQLLHKKLLSAQSELSLCLVSMVNDRQSTIIQTLQDLSDKSESMQINCSSSLSNLTRQLEEEFERTKGITLDAQHILLDLVKEAELFRSQLRVLESLRDPVMKLRESSIPNAQTETYQWMLSHAVPGHPFPDVRFLEWLEEEDGIFWVTGKPGSGKSTLMKFVYSNRQTLQSLQQWAGDQRLVVGGHFFWIAGYDLQRAQEGLLRTLLHKILTECPSLMPTVVPERWRNVLLQNIPWTLIELVTALKRFKQISVPETKFCFFIDALDEYDGSHDDLAEIIAMLCDSRTIKICLSSREWPIFNHYFGVEREMATLDVRKIRLQLYTQNDIRLYIKSRLKDEHRYQKFWDSELKKTVSRQERALIDEMTQRAEGVFLWVSLVCDELLRGFKNLDSPETLRERLRSLPTDLEQYFLRMIEKIEPVYHTQCVQILQLILTARRPILTRLLDFIDGEPMFGIQQTPTLLPYTDATRAVQVKSRGADLIELTNRTEQTWKFGPDVTFMHRTVRDFLSTPSMQGFLRSKLPADFDVHSYLLQAFVVQMRLAWNWGVRLDRSQVRLIIEDIVYHVRELESRSLLVNGTLVDNLLSAIPYFYLTWAKDEAVLAGRARPEKQCQLTLLEFAVDQGLHKVVARQLDEDPELIKWFPGEISLLHCILEKDLNSIPLKSKNDFYEIIKLLLSRGASPNQSAPLVGTPWTCVLKKIKEGAPRDKDEWVDIVSAFIEAGACDHAFDNRTRLKVREIFNERQARKLERIIQNCEASKFPRWYLQHTKCYRTFVIDYLGLRDWTTWIAVFAFLLMGLTWAYFERIMAMPYLQAILITVAISISVLGFMCILKLLWDNLRQVLMRMGVRPDTRQKSSIKYH